MRAKKHGHKVLLLSLCPSLILDWFLHVLIKYHLFSVQFKWMTKLHFYAFMLFTRRCLKYRLRKTKWLTDIHLTKFSADSIDSLYWIIHNYQKDNTHDIVLTNRLLYYISLTILINHSFSPPVSLSISLVLFVLLSTVLSIPLYLHFLWPLNTSLRLLVIFVKSQDDFHTSAVPLINNTYLDQNEGHRG